MDFPEHRRRQRQVGAARIESRAAGAFKEGPEDRIDEPALVLIADANISDNAVGVRRYRQIDQQLVRILGAGIARPAFAHMIADGRALFGGKPRRVAAMGAAAGVRRAA